MNKKPIYNVTAGVLYEHGKVLIKKRPPGDIHGGFWEFPGGKKESWEDLKECLKRELQEELGIEVSVGEYLYTLTHEYQHGTVILHFFRCRPISDQLDIEKESEIKWVYPEELEEYDLLPPDRKFSRFFLKWRERHDRGACSQNKELSKVL